MLAADSVGLRVGTMVAERGQRWADMTAEAKAVKTVATMAVESVAD